jgi:hypothetical protein
VIIAAAMKLKKARCVVSKGDVLIALAIHFTIMGTVDGLPNGKSTRGHCTMGKPVHLAYMGMSKTLLLGKVVLDLVKTECR